MNKASPCTGGILLLDKPVGISSNQALGKAKHCLGIRKAGHAGTLDPFATGLLLCAFGQATKANAYLLKADKTYRATLQLGRATTTGDIEGERIQESDVPVLGRNDWQIMANQFIGEQLQTPPMYSALKHNGVPLYQLAREGKVVERKARPVTVHTLDIVRCNGSELDFEVSCSTGTYIRTLAEDIARAAGTVGHLSTLRRLSIGQFSIENAVTLDALSAMAHPAECLQSVELALQHLPVVDLPPEQARLFLHGQTLCDAPVGMSGDTLVHADQCRVLTSGRFLGVGVVVEKGLRAQRLFTTMDDQR